MILGMPGCKLDLEANTKESCADLMELVEGDTTVCMSTYVVPLVVSLLETPMVNDAFYIEMVLSSCNFHIYLYSLINASISARKQLNKEICAS
jgi:hypothetical protein